MMLSSETCKMSHDLTDDTSPYRHKAAFQPFYFSIADLRGLERRRGHTIDSARGLLDSANMPAYNFVLIPIDQWQLCVVQMATRIGVVLNYFRKYHHKSRGGL